MDLNDLRNAVMLLLFGAFIGVVAWAWSRRNQPSFDEAANLPFAETPARRSVGHERGTSR